MSKSGLVRIILVVAFWIAVGVPIGLWIAEMWKVDRQVASKAHVYQKEIDKRLEGRTMTRRQVDDLAQRFTPDETFPYKGKSVYWFFSRLRGYDVEIQYLPAGLPGNATQDEASASWRREESRSSPDDRAISVTLETISSAYSDAGLITQFVRFATSLRIFLVSLPFLFLWLISRVVRSKIWRAGLRPFWIPAVLWIAYGVWEVFIMPQGGIRADRVMIWPFLLLASFGAAIVSSWRLVQAGTADATAN